MSIYIILKSEFKINNKAELDYIQEEVISTEVYYDKAKNFLNKSVDKCLKDGYFNKIVKRSPNMAQLHNGGTVYMRFSIIRVE